jgi:DNA invertase Pin-like site-specific DNA recombinase
MNKFRKEVDSSPITGAAYIRFSSEMQSDSFSLDAQLRQIREQAERDGVTIVQVFSDPAQSAYHKKYRPGINQMREAARRGEFKILYVHKVDRLARRLEWALEIVVESLQQKLELLEKPQEGVIGRAAVTVLNLRESWKIASEKNSVIWSR